MDEITTDELNTYYETTHQNKGDTLTIDELRAYSAGYRNSFGDGPPGTPTNNGNLVFVDGVNGDLTCVELAFRLIRNEFAMQSSGV